MHRHRYPALRGIISAYLVLGLMGCAQKTQGVKLADATQQVVVGLDQLRDNLAKRTDVPFGLYLCEADVAMNMSLGVNGGVTVAEITPVGLLPGLSVMGTGQEGNTLTLVFRSAACGATPEKTNVPGGPVMLLRHK